MEIKLKLTNEEHKELVAYCNLNDLLISSVVKDSFTTGFNIERYGLLNTNVTQEKKVEKEKIVEKRVEVPVEVIKEVVKVEYVEIEKPIEIIKEVSVEKIVEKPIEIIKEVPVEKIVIQEVIKEVPVEKVVYVTDQKELNEKLFQKDEEMENQRKKFSNRIEEMEKIFQSEKKELNLKISELENKPPQIIEKIVEVTGSDNTNQKVEALQTTVQKLKQDNIEKDRKIKELEKTIEEIQKFQEERKAIYLRGSNLDDKLYK